MRNRIILLMAAGLFFTAACALYAHEHKAPHNGLLVECGDEYAHLELLAAPGAGRITGWVLDGEAENPVRLKQKNILLRLFIGGKKVMLALKAVANPLTGEVAGDTSEFTAVLPVLKGVTQFSGAVTMINVGGVVFKNLAFNYPGTDEQAAAQEKNK